MGFFLFFFSSAPTNSFYGLWVQFLLHNKSELEKASGVTKSNLSQHFPSLHNPPHPHPLPCCLPASSQVHKTRPRQEASRTGGKLQPWGGTWATRRPRWPSPAPAKRRGGRCPTATSTKAPPPVSELLYLNPGTALTNVYFGPFRTAPFLPSALGAMGSSRVCAHVRVNDHVCAGACAPRHTRRRQCPGLCTPPTGWPPPTAVAARWRCAAPRVQSASADHPSLASRPRASGACGRLALCPRARASLPGPAFSVFPGLPARSALGRGPGAAPPGPPGEGGRAAGRAPPLPCRPRPGAPLGFSMTASGRGPPLFPPSLRAGPPRSCAPGFFQGSTGAWRSRVLRPRGRRPRKDPRDPLREAEPSPDVTLRPCCPQGLPPPSPTFVRKVGAPGSRASALREALSAPQVPRRTARCGAEAARVQCCRSRSRSAPASGL